MQCLAVAKEQIDLCFRLCTQLLSCFPFIFAAADVCDDGILLILLLNGSAVKSTPAPAGFFKIDGKVPHDVIEPGRRVPGTVLEVRGHVLQDRSGTLFCQQFRPVILKGSRDAFLQGKARGLAIHIKNFGE